MKTSEAMAVITFLQRRNKCEVDSIHTEQRQQVISELVSLYATKSTPTLGVLILHSPA